MTTSRVLAAAAFLALAAAGCSSSDDSSAAPDPGALASSIQAQATPPASTAADPGGDSEDCGSAPLSAKAALAGMSVTEVSMVSGCTSLYIKTPVTDPAIGVDMCEKAAGEVYQMGVQTIAVESDSGEALAVGSPATGCKTP